MSRYPKANARNQQAGNLGWVDLPARGRKGKAPALPPIERDWLDATVAEWKRVWRSPQATRWDPSGRTLWRWVELLDRWLSDPESLNAPLLAEMRQQETEHGMTAKAMLQLRWRIADDVTEQPVKARTSGNAHGGPSPEAETGAAVLTLLKGGA